MLKKHLLKVESDVRRIIEELPEDQKTLLLMRMYQDMSFKEISVNITGVSINTTLGKNALCLLICVK
jgi:RNA polymerase sigma-70 factor (ECF subfamily)